MGVININNNSLILSGPNLLSAEQKYEHEHMFSSYLYTISVTHYVS